MDGKVLVLLTNVRVLFLVTGVSASVSVGSIWITDKLDVLIFSATDFPESFYSEA